MRSTERDEAKGIGKCRGQLSVGERSREKLPQSGFGNTRNKTIVGAANQRDGIDLDIHFRGVPGHILCIAPGMALWFVSLAITHQNDDSFRIGACRRIQVIGRISQRGTDWLASTIFPRHELLFF